MAAHHFCSEVTRSIMGTISGKLINSSLSMLVIRFIQRGIGLISMLILARILVPEDFGIVAVTSMVVLLCDALASAGSNQYIIQKQNVGSQDLNTAWTINIILKTILWVVLELSAPFISSYFDDPRLTGTISVAACMFLISSFLNPGLNLIHKNLEYSKLIKVSVIAKLAGFLVTIGIAVTFRSYWALIVGNLVITVADVIGSYIIHDFRPRLSLSRFKEQWGFSKWMLLQAILGYLRSQVDKVLVAKFFGISDVGVYHVSKTLTEMPGRDVVAPVLDPLLPAFSKDNSNMETLSSRVRIAFFVVMSIVIPVAAYICAFSTPIVGVLLGGKWSLAGDLMAAFSFLLVTYAVASICQSCLLSLGRTKEIFIYNLVSVIVVAGLLLLVLFFDIVNIVEFAIYRTGLELVIVFLLLAYVGLVLKVSIFRFSMLCFPSLVCAVTSLYAYEYLIKYDFAYQSVELVFSAMCFFAIYCISMCGSLFLLSRYIYEANNALEILSPYFSKIMKKFEHR